MIHSHNSIHVKLGPGDFFSRWGMYCTVSLKDMLLKDTHCSTLHLLLIQLEANILNLQKVSGLKQRNITIRHVSYPFHCSNISNSCSAAMPSFPSSKAELNSHPHLLKCPSFQRVDEPQTQKPWNTCSIYYLQEGTARKYTVQTKEREKGTAKEL